MSEERLQEIKDSISLQYKVQEANDLNNFNIFTDEEQELVEEIERLNNIINEALGIANERFNYYSNHKNNNQEHLEDWGNIFNILLRRDDK